MGEKPPAAQGAAAAWECGQAHRESRRRSGQSTASAPYGTFFHSAAKTDSRYSQLRTFSISMERET